MEVLVLIAGSVLTLAATGFVIISLFKYYQLTRLEITRLVRKRYAVTLGEFIDRVLNANSVQKRTVLDELHKLVKAEKVDLVFASMLESRINNSIPLPGASFYKGLGNDQLDELTRALHSGSQEAQDKLVDYLDKAKSSESGKEE